MKNRCMRRTLLIALLIGASGVGAADVACAQDFGKGIAEALGFATETPPPAPFVQQSRPTGDLPWVNIFATPAEPARKPLSEAERQALQRSLEGIDKRNESLIAKPAPQPNAAHRYGKKKTPPDAASPGESGTP